MSAGSIFCEYIYGSFLLVSAALEVGMSLAKTTLSMLSTMFDACISLFRFTIDVGSKAIIDGVKVLQKQLVDLIWDGYQEEEELDPETGEMVKTGKKKSKFCNNLYKCNIFIEELTDSNSLICKTLISLGVITPEQQQYVNEIISEYDEFMNTICTYGFTFNFGISALKKLLNWYKKQLNGFLDTIERKKEDIRRFIQKYMNKLQDSGIFDLMAKLRKFFNCILEQTDSCTSLKTTENFYTNALKKMKIEESGTGGYKLESSTNNSMMNAFDSRLNQLNNVKDEIQKSIDALVSPSAARAASKAFNLSKHVFPGGMSWNDIKHGRWQKNSMVHYFTAKKDKFMEVFMGRHGSKLPGDTSTEFVLSGMKINDKTGKIVVDVNGVHEEIDVNDPVMMRAYSGAVTLNILDTPIEYYVEGDENADAPDSFFYNGEIISALRASIMISVEGDTELEKFCNERVAGVAGRLREDQLMVEW